MVVVFRRGHALGQRAHGGVPQISDGGRVGEWVGGGGGGGRTRAPATRHPMASEDAAQRLSAQLAHGRVSGDAILARVFHTVCEMLADRGYTLQTICQSSDDLAARMKQRKSVVTARRGTRQCLAFFESDDKVSIKFLRAIRDAHPEALLLVVSAEGPTAFAKKEVNDPWGEHVPFFPVQELTRNVARHELVPTHVALDADERAALIARYHLKLEQLPVLLPHDPIRRYYDFGPGDVVRILRRGVAQEEVPFYRIVQAAGT